MEAPLTCQETPKSEESFIIKYNNHEYNIIFQNFSNSICIKASYFDDILNHDYEKNYELNELKNNKYLNMCETIDEIYGELIFLLKKNQTKLLENNNEISIIIPLEPTIIKEIIFILEEKSKKEEENIKELILVISDMKVEINKLKEELNISNQKNIELNNKITSLEQENIIFKEKMDKIQNYIPFLEELKKDLKERILFDYPFQNDKLNHSPSTKWATFFSFGKDKASLTEFKNLKCIVTNGLLAVKTEIDLNNNWIIQFEYCKFDWSPADWSHIFSFGLHNNYGGDDSYYAITLDTKPRDGYQIMRLTKSNAGDGNWHTITARYTKNIKLLEGLIDNNVIEKKYVSLGTTSGFYFGGQGCGGEFSMYLRNFKFIID